MNQRDFEQQRDAVDGHILTPRHIIEFLRQISINTGQDDNWPKSVADPACGSSKFLLNSFEIPLPSPDIQRQVIKEVEAFIKLTSQESPCNIPSELVASRKSNDHPQFGEKLLLLLLTREERRTNIVGDLAEEYAQIRSKHGARFGNIWYWKQVITSFGPILRKALRWGLLLGVGGWIRKHIL